VRGADGGSGRPHAEYAVAERLRSATRWRLLTHTRAVLQERSRANKAAYDQRRLDSFYQKDFRLNKLLRADVLPEPCDPRQPEFRTKCLPNGGLLPPEALK
jgi:hypothetical protein